MKKQTNSLFDPNVIILNFYEITQMNNENLSTQSNKHNEVLKNKSKKNKSSEI